MKFLGLVLLTIVAGIIVGALLASAWTSMQGLSAVDQRLGDSLRPIRFSITWVTAEKSSLPAPLSTASS